ncbi:peptidoglycan recognition family protein [Nocardioides sp. CPCC 205120]|uniref:peptidoglycan recognition protein family protein n=1 Tax=Nocardioides sp. CPCC 205120 TaxID=3406462 RepID=UPI003B50ECDF
MTRYSRADWRADRPTGSHALVPSQVVGVALHWPAMGKKRLVTRDEIAQALRGWQDFHQGKGWSDIGYQVAVDQNGNRWDLRGLRARSGANGTNALNRRYVAVLLILGEGEQPTEQMLREVRTLLGDIRDLYPGAVSVVGHGDIRPGGTACPGPVVGKLIDAGAFYPTASTAYVRQTGPKVRAAFERLYATEQQRNAAPTGMKRLRLGLWLRIVQWRSELTVAQLRALRADFSADLAYAIRRGMKKTTLALEARVRYIDRLLTKKG